jgi:hypothetical protein
MYLMSLLGRNGREPSSRNPLLLNKSDDLLSDEHYPANWWRQPDKRGYRKDEGGYWIYPGSASVQTSTQAFTPAVVLSPK